VFPAHTARAAFVAFCCALAARASVPVITLSPLNAATPAASESDDTVALTITFSVPKYVLPLHEQELVASCLVLEAASQGEFGMRAVMAVIRNRARGLPELFVPTVLKEKQFSALNRLTAGRESSNRVIARARADQMWEIALGLVAEATLPSWYDPTNGATHYTRTGERTRWTRSLAQTTIIGRHAFYR
jgi:spore germination cell wall hydrolase CwlJ-like protein